MEEKTTSMEKKTTTMERIMEISKLHSRSRGTSLIVYYIAAGGKT